MAITPTRQRNSVSEGIALGMLMCGRATMPSDRFKVGLSFEGAWAAWPYVSEFPQVDHDLRMGLSGEIVITRADEKKSTAALYWERTTGGYEIVARQAWADDAKEVARLIDGDLSADAWKALAEEFIQRLES